MVSIFWRTWIIISGIRVGLFAALLLLDSTQKLPRSAVLLTLPLHPEGLLVSHGVAWSVLTAALFIVALVAGSAVMAAVFAIAVRRLRRHAPG